MIIMATMWLRSQHTMACYRLSALSISAFRFYMHLHTIPSVEYEYTKCVPKKKSVNNQLFIQKTREHYAKCCTITHNTSIIQKFVHNSCTETRLQNTFAN